MTNPTPEQIRTARLNAKLTQHQAALLVHLSDSAAWRKWELGRYKMPLATWELFLLKTNQPEPRTENPAPDATQNPAPDATQNPAPDATQNPAPDATQNPAPFPTDNFSPQ